MFDIAFNPIDIDLLGAQGIVLHPDARPHLIQQTQRLGIGGAVDERRGRPVVKRGMRVVFHFGDRSFLTILY